MKETIQFYTESLGFELGMCFPDADNPEYADLNKDGMVVMVIPAINLGIGNEEKLGTGVNFYMQIDGDIDEYYEELKHKNIRITSDIKDELYGIRDFTVEDINGYQLTFNQISRSAKNCMSCGMPMNKLEDFGGGNPANVYCINCTRKNGSLKSYEEVYDWMVGVIMNVQDMNQEAAGVAAKEYLSRMPAWTGH
jgi:uncharacterized glyoxalase superfamily protein PhnB